MPRGSTKFVVALRIITPCSTCHPERALKNAAISRSQRRRSTPRACLSYPAFGAHAHSSADRDHSAELGRCGWMVSPRASISTYWTMRLARVSVFFALPIRYRKE